MATKIKTYNLTDKLPFGKHKGKTIHQILQKDPNYLLWCVEKLDGFAMSDEAWDYAISINKQWAAMRPNPTSHDAVGIVEQTLADGIEVLAHYPWRDASKAKKSFLTQLHEMAEDALLVVDRPVITPIQLTLF